MSGKNSIQVAIKVRPLLKKDKDQQNFWRVFGNSIQLLDSPLEPCSFDYIFDQDVSNQIIFDKMAKPIVHSAVKGFNGTIFAYGQTSSGKTYTMMGDDDNPGVMVLAAKEIFKEIEKTQDRQFLLRVGYIEIYNEKICDLLNKKHQDLKIHETATGIVSVNCEEIIIRSEDDLLNNLEKGGKERTVGETNMNERSSRSHAIFRIIIESRKIDRSEDDAVTQSVINLVDLAGSERADQTGARGARLKEGAHINKSLLFLGTVIKRLSENEDDKFIGFRDSKLTRILQASLGGNALTAIICTIKTNAIEETQSTLSFALRAKSIKNKPQVNEIVSDATMMKRLEHEIKVLKIRLEEEQRKNESQLKVRQLEQRIRDEDLKIISCNSLHSVRNCEKRRRTWCTSSTNSDATGQAPSALPVPSFNSQLSQPSRLPAPKTFLHNTPLITIRQSADEVLLPAPNTASGLPFPSDNLPDIDEEFAPAELVNFERISPVHTPRKKELERNISITPKLIGCVKSTLEKVEQDLQELQSFTNLENKVDVQHEPVLTLKHKVETLTQRNAELEKERLAFLHLQKELELKTEGLNQRNAELEQDVLNLIPLKHDQEMLTKSLTESRNRCTQLELQLNQLTESYKSANEEISKYEALVAELKNTNVKLEMENREFVNLEFEFKSQKNKAKLRETELLEALNEKEREISKLEKSLNSLTGELLQNSKEELLQKSMHESGKVDEDGNVCIKCVDLQRLLEENKKVTLEFEKLTLVYDNLKLNYEEIGKENESYKLKITSIEEQQEQEKAECEKLLSEVQQLKEQLHDLQHNYVVLSSENALKQEECALLSKQIEDARQEMLVLEEKFTKLELSWKEQQQTINDIEIQYASIQTKYEHLQDQYEQLQVTRGQSIADYQRLEKENVDLQAEIEALKKKVHDAQQSLLESTTKYETAAKETKAANEELSSKATNIQQESEQLKTQLEDLQAQFEELQKEYESLSNQLIDNLQECESLETENKKLKEDLKDFEDKTDHVSKAEAEINDLRSQLEKVLCSERRSVLNAPSLCRNVSMLSSGVCVEEEDDQFTRSSECEDLFKKFVDLSTSLMEIELQNAKGETILFKSISKTASPKSYKMYLRNILNVGTTIQNEFDVENENMLMQGSCCYSFHISELIGTDKFCDCSEDCENVTAEYVQELKNEIMQLKSISEQEQLSKKSLLENTEQVVREMREQITQLSSELLEKSMFVENCACKTYQQQIKSLEKEKADITTICEELQEKMNSTLNGSTSTNTTLPDADSTCRVDDNLNELEKLKQRQEELLESYNAQGKALEEIKQRCLNLEFELETAHQKLSNQEKEFKECCHQLRLDNLEKLELSAKSHSDNMKKYNKEWEEKKDDYEQIIRKLNAEIAELKQISIKMEIKQEDSSDCRENVQENQTLNTAEESPNQLQSITSELDETEAILSEECRLQQENLGLQLQLNTAKDQVEQLQEENRGKCEEIKLLDSKLVYLEKILTDAKVVNVTLSGENSVLQTELDNTRKDLDCIPVLHETNQELCAEIERLNLKYSCLEANQDKSVFQKQPDSKKDANCAKLTKKEKKARKEEQNNLINDIEKLNQENKELHDALQKAEKLLQEHQQGVCGQESMRTLQTEMDNLTLLETEKERLGHDLETLREQHKQVTAQLENSVHKIAELQMEISSRDEFSKTLQEKLDYQLTLTQNENINSSEECNQMQDKLAKAEQEIEQLRKENASHEELVKTLQDKCDHLSSWKEEKSGLANDYENLQQEHKQLQDKLLKTERQIHELCAEDSSREELIQSLQNKLCGMKDLEEEKESLGIENLRLKELLNSLQEKGEESSREIEILRQQVEKSLKIQAEMSSCESRLQMEKTELSNKLEDIKTKCEALQAEKVLLEGQITQLTEERTTLDDKYSCLRQEKTALEKQLICLKENVEELLTQKTKENTELANSLRLITEKYESAQSEQKKCMSELKEEKRQIEENLEKVQKSFELTNKQLEELTNEKEKEQQKLREAERQVVQLQQEKLDQQLALQSLKETVSKATEEKLQELNHLENSLQKAQNESQQMQLQLEALNDDLAKLQSEHQTKISENTQLQADLLATKDSLAKLHEEQQKTQEKWAHYLKLEEDKNKLEVTLNVLRNAQTGAVATLQEEKVQLLKTLQQYKQQSNDFKEKEETLKQKIDSLSQQLHEMHIKYDSCEKLAMEYEEMESLLTSTTIANQKLQQDISQLHSQQELYVSKIETFSSEIAKLNTHIHKQDEDKMLLENKLRHLKETLQTEKSSLQKENAELKSCLEELKLKFNSLESTNAQLEELNQQLQQQLDSAKANFIKSNDLQEKLSKLEVQHSELQHSLKKTIEETGRCNLNLLQDVDHHRELLKKQQDKYNALDIEMAKKQQSLSEENFQLSAIIETLTREKVALEEKLRHATVRNFELDLKRQTMEASPRNTSSDMDTSYSPKTRPMLERLSNASLEEKSNTKHQKNSITLERKNRRLSAHDERRQSYWGAVHDKETMTDPADTSCNCIELDRKLKDCERSLFIKSSQVTALSMELKNHPLKEENASLKKRIQAEQDKYHTEMKRYKSKLYEQTIKTEKALAAAAHLTAKSTHAELISQTEIPSLAKVVADSETQTDDELSACLQKLQGKYDDLKIICRNRYKMIKELEEKVAQKENSDGNSSSALEAVKIANVKKQCESLTKELTTIKTKYDAAKKVLLSRREEIIKLRAQLDQVQ